MRMRAKKSYNIEKGFKELYLYGSIYIVKERNTAAII